MTSGRRGRAAAARRPAGDGVGLLGYRSVFILAVYGGRAEGRAAFSAAAHHRAAAPLFALAAAAAAAAAAARSPPRSRSRAERRARARRARRRAAERAPRSPRRRRRRRRVRAAEAGDRLREYDAAAERRHYGAETASGTSTACARTCSPRSTAHGSSRRGDAASLTAPESGGGSAYTSRRSAAESTRARAASWRTTQLAHVRHVDGARRGASDRRPALVAHRQPKVVVEAPVRPTMSPSPRRAQRSARGGCWGARGGARGRRGGGVEGAKGVWYQTPTPHVAGRDRRPAVRPRGRLRRRHAVRRRRVARAQVGGALRRDARAGAPRVRPHVPARPHQHRARARLEHDAARTAIVMDHAGVDLFHGRVPLARATSSRSSPAWRTCTRAGSPTRDLKMENVLLDGAGRVRIADFGLAIQVRSDRVGERVCRTCGSSSTRRPRSGAARTTPCTGGRVVEQPPLYALHLDAGPFRSTRPGATEERVFARWRVLVDTGTLAPAAAPEEAPRGRACRPAGARRARRDAAARAGAAADALHDRRRVRPPPPAPPVTITWRGEHDAAPEGRNALRPRAPASVRERAAARRPCGAESSGGRRPAGGRLRLFPRRPERDPFFLPRAHTTRVHTHTHTVARMETAHALVALPGQRGRGGRSGRSIEPAPQDARRARARVVGAPPLPRVEAQVISDAEAPARAASGARLRAARLAPARPRGAERSRVARAWTTTASAPPRARAKLPRARSPRGASLAARRRRRRRRPATGRRSGGARRRIRRRRACERAAARRGGAVIIVGVSAAAVSAALEHRGVAQAGAAFPGCPPRRRARSAARRRPPRAARASGPRRRRRRGRPPTGRRPGGRGRRPSRRRAAGPATRGGSSAARGAARAAPRPRRRRRSARRPRRRGVGHEDVGRGRRTRRSRRRGARAGGARRAADAEERGEARRAVLAREVDRGAGGAPRRGRREARAVGVVRPRAPSPSSAGGAIGTPLQFFYPPHRAAPPPVVNLCPARAPPARPPARPPSDAAPAPPRDQLGAKAVPHAHAHAALAAHRRRRAPRAHAHRAHARRARVAERAALPRRAGFEGTALCRALLAPVAWPLGVARRRLAARPRAAAGRARCSAALRPRERDRALLRPRRDARRARRQRGVHLFLVAILGCGMLALPSHNLADCAERALLEAVQRTLVVWCIGLLAAGATLTRACLLREAAAGGGGRAPPATARATVILPAS